VTSQRRLRPTDSNTGSPLPASSQRGLCRAVWGPGCGGPARHDRWAIRGGGTLRILNLGGDVGRRERWATHDPAAARVLAGVSRSEKCYIGKRVTVGGPMQRREFITLLGGAALALPGRVDAQQRSMPLIGYLSGRSPAESTRIVAAFHQGLQDAGFVEGQNVAIESRFAEGDFDRLPTLTNELVRRGVDVLVAAGGNVTVVKAKPVVPTTIPIVFAMGGDPVKLGVVASLNKPGGNITGVSFLVNQLGVKEIELLHELVPNALTIGFLVNPNNPSLDPDMQGAKEAADAFGTSLIVVKAATEGEIEGAFTNFAQQHVDALFVHSDPFFVDKRQNIGLLAMRTKLPAISQLREFAAAGALATYGTSITEANRQLGVYTAKVLRGTKPADLPVILSTRFELTINLRTAMALGLTVSPSLLARADEVIE
jgi:ABC-type uncharacterized transport system substrate-binding protein